MKSKPLAALILLRAEWFDSVVALPELVDAVQADADEIHQALAPYLDIAGSWVVNDQASLQACRQALRLLEADLVILAFQVWAEDTYLVPLVEAIGRRPMVVWCYVPWSSPPAPVSFVEVLRASGPVGTFEGLGTLHNLGVKFFFTYGPAEAPRVKKDLSTAAMAGQVWRKLRQARFGLLPERNEQMQSTFVDEFRLRKELGPMVQYIPVAELWRKAGILPQSEVESYVDHLIKQYPIRGVEPEDLELAARASLGLAHLAQDYQLDVLSLNDIAPELHRVLGLRPCLYPPLIEQARTVLSLEGDLGAATALFILHQLAGDPLLFTEIWFWDEPQNLIVGGHAGPQNPGAAVPGQAWISHDYEFAQSDRSRGAHFQFVARPGRVTLLQLRGTPDGWQAILSTGDAVETEPWLEGYPHAVVRLDASLDSFIRRTASAGSTQHWIMAYGDYRAEVQALMEWLGVPLEVIL